MIITGYLKTLLQIFFLLISPKSCLGWIVSFDGHCAYPDSGASEGNKYSVQEIKAPKISLKSRQSQITQFYCLATTAITSYNYKGTNLQNLTILITSRLHYILKLILFIVHYLAAGNNITVKINGCIYLVRRRIRHRRMRLFTINK